jgi:hypothetical protein
MRGTRPRDGLSRAKTHQPNYAASSADGLSLRRSAPALNPFYDFGAQTLLKSPENSALQNAPP